MGDQKKYVNAYVDSSTNQIVLLRLDESRKNLIEERAPASWVSYVLLSELTPEFRRDIVGDERVKGLQEEGRFARIEWQSPKRVGYGRHRLDWRRDAEAGFEARGVRSFEGDVHPILRYFVDHGLGIERPRRCYLDIEADSKIPFARKEEMRIFCICVRGDDGARARFVLREDSDLAEKKLLKEFWEYISGRYDQACAWNGDPFDYAVIFARMSLHDLDVNGDLLLWLDQLAVFKRMNVTASESGDEKTSMKLDDVATSLLGHGKSKFNSAKTRDAYDAGHGPCTDHICPGCGEHHDYSAIECMVRYCEVDVDLLVEIEGKTGYLDLFFTLCEADGIFPDTLSTNPTLQADGFMLRLGKERGEHFITRKNIETPEKFAGAFVMEPTFEGITKDVHFADFSRMYPSIIVTWNISPETKVGVYDPETKLVTILTGEQVPMRDEWCRAPRTNIVFDQSREGILPIAVKEMLRLRGYWDKMKAGLPPGTPEWKEADRRSTAYKIAANSFFGVVSSPFSRFYDRQVGESITQGGVELLMRVNAAAAERGYHAGYGDTDSSAVKGPTNAQFAEFVAWCNTDLFPKVTKEYGCKNCSIQIAYEKKFSRIVFTGKKRYAGVYEHFKGKPALPSSKPEIKGFEFKRGDTLKLARVFQEEAIKKILGDWDPNCTRCGHSRVAHEAGDEYQKARPCSRCSCSGFTGKYPEPTENLADYHDLVGRWQNRILHGKLKVEECSIAKSVEKALPPTDKEVSEYVEVQKQKALKKQQEWTKEDELNVADEFHRKYERKHGGNVYSVRRKNDGGKVALPPHVQVAMILKDRGEEVNGAKIAYVVVDGYASPMKVIPASEFTEESVDRYYIWENLVWPPTERVLCAAFPEHDWSGWGKVRPKKQRQPRKPKVKDELVVKENKIVTTRLRVVAKQGHLDQVKPVAMLESPSEIMVLKDDVSGRTLRVRVKN